jgi:hypothetical protein
MYTKPQRCQDCDGGIIHGDGRCSHCHGSAVNLNLASDVPQCLFCKGTGVCTTCQGTGQYPPQPDEDQRIHTLFNP